MDDIHLLNRKLARETAARNAAEAILESKSLELHQSKVAVEEVAKQLRTQNVRIQAIVDSAAEGILTLDFDYCILSFNPSAERIFATTSSSATGNSFLGLVNGLQKETLNQFMASDQFRIDPKEYTTNGQDQQAIVEITISKTVGDDSSSMIVIVRDRTKSKQLESQLEVARKMESIGQMAAGIAHEINSPMQYVSDNTRFLQNAFVDIEALLNKYDELVRGVKTAGNLDDLVGAIEREYAAADLDFTLQEVPQAISQTIDGAAQVSKIVQAMKVFSHPGETEISTFNLNDAIRSTVDVSKNEWKYLARIDLQLDEELPYCCGYPSKLNQALLNLVINAAHAIDKRSQTQPELQGVIRIETGHCDQWIHIDISDNGCGIPTEQLHKVYDPFFTTKPVGKGTGQGLSITHSIVVETHHGKIDIESTVDQGTTFHVRLPLCLNTEPSVTDCPQEV